MAEREVLADLVSALSYQAACNVVVSSREKLEFAQDKVWAAVDAAQKLLASPPVAVQEEMDLRKKYDELIYAVGRKYAGQTRHETALMYIRNAERDNGSSAMKAEQS